MFWAHHAGLAGDLHPAGDYLFSKQASYHITECATTTLPQGPRYMNAEMSTLDWETILLSETLCQSDNQRHPVTFVGKSIVFK